MEGREEPPDVLRAATKADAVLRGRVKVCPLPQANHTFIKEFTSLSKMQVLGVYFTTDVP